MTADELIAYIRGVISTTSPQTDNASMHRAVSVIRDALNNYPSDKNCSDAMDRYMRKAIPSDLQKAKPYIPSIIPYKSNPPITPPTGGMLPNYPLPDKFWLNVRPMDNTGDYR